MNYQLDFTTNALQDLADLKKSEPNAFKKANKLLAELINNPRKGTGKPKPLKGLQNVFSKRID